jgi:hypothetical protein
MRLRLNVEPLDFSKRTGCCSSLLMRMYSMDDLLSLVYSESADELRLHVGVPPVIVVKGEH